MNSSLCQKESSTDLDKDVPTVRTTWMAEFEMVPDKYSLLRFSRSQLLLAFNTDTGLSSMPFLFAKFRVSFGWFCDFSNFKNRSVMRSTLLNRMVKSAPSNESMSICWRLSKKKRVSPWVGCLFGFR